MRFPTKALSSQMQHNGDLYADIERTSGVPPSVMTKSVQTDRQTKDLIRKHSQEMMSLVPNVIDHYKKTLEIASKIDRYLNGDTTINETPIKEVEDMNHVLKRSDVVMLNILKSAGMIQSSSLSLYIQQVYNQSNTTVLAPDVIKALGAGLLGDTSAHDAEYEVVDDD